MFHFEYNIFLFIQEALNTLNKSNLTELKSFGSPPGVVTNVTAAVMVLLAQNGKIPKDRSWKAAKVCIVYLHTNQALIYIYIVTNIFLLPLKTLKFKNLKELHLYSIILG